MISKAKSVSILANLKFRFGNNQTLQSEYQAQLPLHGAPGSKKGLWLTIEVLPGGTPFLFSKRAFKQLGGILNTTNDTCYLQRLEREISLELNPTELYFIDVFSFANLPVPVCQVFINQESCVGLRSIKGENRSGGVHDSQIPVENILLSR